MRPAVSNQAVAAPTKPLDALLVRLAELRSRGFELGVAACTFGVGAFLVLQLTAWPPHEDETLALFVGRESIGAMLRTVLDQRGGAPLHFLLAWVVAHTGGGLVGLRLVSTVFATASVPVVAALGARLAGRLTGLVATVLLSGSWMLLFHGVYGRMYSLFLFTSSLSMLALLNAADRSSRRAWGLWVLAILACIAAHPYGALVLAAQGVWVLVARVPLRRAAPAFALVAVAGIPFWRTDLVLAGRFDVGVTSGPTRLNGPGEIARYLELVASDFTAGYTAVVTPVLLLALAGLVDLLRRWPRRATLAASAAATPIAALVLAKLGSAAPMSRHLIFIFPFFMLAVARGLLLAAQLARRAAPAVTCLVVAALVPAEVAWGWHKTPELYRGEPRARVAARAAASAWLAATSRPDDVLFGYEPLYLQAWERGGHVSQTVIPRADSKLALKTLEAIRKPLGHGVWMFDASDTTNLVRRLEIPLTYPQPRSAFQVRAFGPFLIVRTVNPTRSVRTYLKLSRRVELVGESLSLGDADVNLLTVELAADRFAHEQRARALAQASARATSG
ncbi:MAG TPA: hypothetical protein VFA44_09730 [Gaiellaceae bacterium]|nr:hypothetical protein [Gaiellaceae bacterium]